ncbi:natural cytotoxicity triggering receptor 3 [Mus caroli]|uniref:Natural cytotoxicity triggering receptor 3 n=1 Tax=Mus caroli TaxID=10089 RepID=A0A6P5NXT6_MUSCR|nr:natural cytotoxicity triggering receptor 3 [Mus caroli]
MAKVLLVIFIMVYPGSCALWVSQPPETPVQKDTTASLPCPFNAIRGKPATGSVTWYQDKVTLGMELSNVTPGFGGRLVSFSVSQFIRDHKAGLLIQDTQSYDAGIYVCRVEVLGLGVRTGDGTWLLVEKGPPQQASNTEQEAHTSILLRAGFYALSFLSVATGSTIYYQGKCPCHMENMATPPAASEK